MKLTDLIKALAVEVDIMQPQLEELIDGLKNIDVQDDNYIAVIESYNDYVMRLGEASEMVDFMGVKLLCDKAQDNTLLLLSCADEEREKLTNFLRNWCVNLSKYLSILDEDSLNELLAVFQLAPTMFSEDELIEVTKHLKEKMEEAHGGAIFKDEENIRQTEATVEDIDIDLPEDIDQNLMDGFLQESPDMANDLVSWAKQIVAGEPILVEDLQRAKRYTHTLKGTGATIGARGLASVGHNLEDILEYLEENTEEANNYLNNLLLDSAYCLEQMVAYIAGVDEAPENSLFILQQLLDVANKIDNGESLADLSSSNFVVANQQQSMQPQNDEAITDDESIVDNSDQSNVETTTQNQPRQDNKAVKKKRKKNKDTKQSNKVSTLRVPVKKVNDLFRVAGEISIHSSAMEDKIKVLSEQTQKLLEQNLRVQKRLFELETMVDVRALEVTKTSTNDPTTNHEFDPLEMDQYNELHSASHALMEDSADARMFANLLEDQVASLASMQSRQQVLSRDLQHLVISTRMSEVGELESRLQRNIRTTGQMTGKMVNLEMTGQDTLIDSDLIGKLADPLLHLLRNAVDHGIETPEERAEKGKDAAGTIYLDFLRQGQQVVMRCEDDGKGLDLEKIRNRALEHGLITEQQMLTDTEIAQLIFKSGFSSRDAVSEISGRGVGLDVVRDWANQMNGSIHIQEGESGGCLFELRFSASLSTIQSLIVSSADDCYFALPAIQIEQAVSNNVGRFEYLNGKFSYYFQEEYIAAHFLSDLVGLQTDNSKDLSEYYAVIIALDGKRYALAVNKLMDSRELLVTPPGRFAKHLQGVSGLSILGNGAIAVNLDISQLLLQSTGDRSLRSQNNNAVQETKQTPKVLIVDDALTVRNALQQFVEDIGFEAHTAKDGFDAVTILEEMTPTVILTDMEMPNMNGVELTRYIRTKDNLKDLPVVMITSRSQTKHRELAEEAGVSDYITKPYNDTALLASIKQFL